MWIPDFTHSKTAAVIGGALGGLAAVVVITIAFCYLWRHPSRPTAGPGSPVRNPATPDPTEPNPSVNMRHA